MRTWLDGFCRGAANRVTRFSELLGVGPHARARTDDGEAMKLLIEKVVAAFRGVEGRTAEDIGGIRSLYMKIAPFLLGPAPETPRPSALALSSELAATFANCRVSEEVLRLGKAEILRRELTYIDISHRALMIGDHLQVRAVFVEKVPSLCGPVLTPAAEHGVRFTTILTPPDENGYRQISWLDGGRNPVPDDCDTELLAQFGYRLPCLADALESLGVEMQDVLTDVENCVYLTLAYACTAGDDALGPALPHIPAGHPRRSGRRSRQVAKKFSLFIVRPLRTPSDRFGRQGANDAARGGWKLGHRVQVHGHFRLQPFGKGGKQRRLIWIEEHERGPRDAVPRTPLTLLKPQQAQHLDLAEAAANDNAPDPGTYERKASMLMEKQ